MQYKKLSRDNRGITLVEVLIGVAITGGLALTLAKLTGSASQNAKQVEAKLENLNLKNMVQNLLTDTDSCRITFWDHLTTTNIANLSASPSNSLVIPQIKNKLNVAKFATSTLPTLVNISPLAITSMRLTNYDNVLHTGDLVIKSTFKKSPTSTVELKQISIPLNFTYSGAAFDGCSYNPIASSSSGGEWLVAGNSDIQDNGAYFLGTTNSAPLVFKVNNLKAGRIDSSGQVYMGVQAGNSSTTGQNNTGIGKNSLRANTTGTQNTAMGESSLFNNISGNFNVAIGARSLLQNMTSNFLTAIGYNALENNTTGTMNLAVGYSSMKANTTGAGNTAVGYEALQSNTIGFNSTAVGKSALTASTSGGSNTAMGSQTLQMTTTGMGNSALGVSALYGNLSGNFNTAIGNSAMASGTNPSNNVAVGMSALQQSNGNFNTAIGTMALMQTAVGNSNAVVGSSALSNLTSGSLNTAIGSSAGSMITSGSSNIIIGGFSGGATTLSNKLFIETRSAAPVALIAGDFAPGLRKVTIDGNLGVGTQNPNYALEVVGDINATSNVRAAGIVLTSDLRLKENIHSLKNSLEKISELNAYSYQWKDRKNQGKKTHLGLMAQEVKKVFPEAVETNTNGFLGISYTSLIAPIIESIKILRKEIEVLKIENETLREEMKLLLKKMEKDQKTAAATTLPHI